MTVSLMPHRVLLDSSVSSLESSTNCSSCSSHSLPPPKNQRPRTNRSTTREKVQSSTENRSPFRDSSKNIFSSERRDEKRKVFQTADDNGLLVLRKATPLSDCYESCSTNQRDDQNSYLDNRGGAKELFWTESVTTNENDACITIPLHKVVAASSKRRKHSNDVFRESRFEHSIETDQLFTLKRANPVCDSHAEEGDYSFDDQIRLKNESLVDVNSKRERIGNTKALFLSDRVSEIRGVSVIM